MTTVLDASVVIKALTDGGPEGEWAKLALTDPEPTGPELMLAEAGNFLRRLELQGKLSRIEATMAFRDLLLLPIVLFPFAPYAERVWELRHNVTGYDAWYIAIAESLGCPFVTLDFRLSRAVGPACEIVVPPWAEQPLE